MIIMKNGYFMKLQVEFLIFNVLHENKIKQNKTKQKTKNEKTTTTTTKPKPLF